MIDSYKVALRELLALSFAVSALAILEPANASFNGKLSHFTVVFVLFLFIVIIIYASIRYYNIAQFSADRLRYEDDLHVWLSCACVIAILFLSSSKLTTQ